MTEEPIRTEMRRHAPGIYISRLWGIMNANRYEAAIKKRMAFIAQFDDVKYVIIADMRDVIHVNRPNIDVAKKLTSHDPNLLGFILVGGPRVVRTIGIIANQISKKFYFEDDIDQAIQLAEDILQKNT